MQEVMSLNMSKVLLACIVSTLFVHHVKAEEKRYIFDIRRQSLSKALLRLARMTGIQLVYISKNAENMKAPSLIGIYSANEALPILLRDSNLRAIFVNKNTIIIKADRQLDDYELTELGYDELGDTALFDADNYQEATGAERYRIMEEVITTGQRIKHPRFRSSSPSITLHYGDFSANGDISNDEMLNVLPQITPHATPNTNNTGANDGSSTVNLRHLGVERTLVLFNGRRLQNANMSGFSDISMIPSSLLDRIDIVTGGASAIYGSGAIAGVVNFIHNKHVDGLRLKSQFGISKYGDAEQYSMSGAYGSSFANGKGNFSFYAEYSNRGSYTEYDRPASRFNPHVSNGRIVESGTSTIPGGRYTYSGKSKYVSPSEIPSAQLPWFQENFETLENGDILINRLIRFSKDGKPLPFVLDDHNVILSEYAYLQNPYQRASLYGFSDYQITDNITFFSELSYIYSQQERKLSPISLRNLYVSRNHPAITSEFSELLRLLEGDDVQTRVKIRTRIPEGGARSWMQNRHYGRIVAGLKGNIRNNWQFEAYMNYGFLRRTTVYKNGYSRLRIQSALGCPVGPDDDDFIPDSCPLTPIYPDGVSINPFGEGNISAQEITFLQGDPLSRNVDTDQFNAAINLKGQMDNYFNEHPILLAAGLEYRHEKASNIADVALTTGEIRGFNQLANYKGSYDIWEAYAEIGIPLVADHPLFYKLDYTGGARISHYSSAGGVFAWRSGLSWEITKGLQFRGEYQRAVRAPNINELFKESAQSFTDLRDPCAKSTGAVEEFCMTLGISDVDNLNSGQRQISSFLKGNLNLDEEISNTYTVGTVWEPAFIPNIVVTVDYYKIAINNVISPPSTSAVAGLCIESRDINNLHCQAIQRDTKGRVIRIDRQYDNLVNKSRSGIDLEINYGFTLEDIGLAENSGALDLRFMGGWMLTSLEQTSKNSQPFDCASFVDDALCGRALPEFKSVFWLNYKNKKLKTTLRWRWLSSVRDGVFLSNPEASAVIPEIPAFHYFDFFANYELFHDLELYGGMQNFFNKQPPLIESEIGANTDPATYDTRGRFFFIGLNKSF